MSSLYTPSGDYGSLSDLMRGLAQKYGTPQQSASPDVRQSNLPAIPQGSTLQAGIQNANSVADEGVAHLNDVGSIQPTIPPIQELSHKIDKNGQTYVNAKITGEAYDHLMSLVQDGQQARSAFAQARQLLAQKQAFLQQNPIVAGLGAIASQAAARYAGGSIANPGGYSRIAPLVQAAGAYGLSQFGQSPDQLAIEQAKLSQEGLQAQEPVTRAILGAQEIQNRQQALEQSNQQQNLSRMLEYRGQIRQATAQGLFTPDDEQTIREESKAFGLQDEQAKALAHSAVAGSEASRQLAEINRKQQLTLEDMKDKSRLQDIIASSNAQMAKMMAMFNHKEVEDQKKLDRLNPVEQKTVTSAQQGMEQLDKIEKTVKENPDFFGPVLGRIPDALVQKAQEGGLGSTAAKEIMKAAGISEDKLQKYLDARAQFANGVNLVRGYGAGSYGFRPTEYKMLFEPLVPSQKDYAPGILAKTSQMRDLFKSELNATVQSYQARGGKIENNEALQKIAGQAPASNDYEQHVKSLPKGVSALSLSDYNDAKSAAAAGQLKPGQKFQSSDGRVWAWSPNGPQPVQ